MIRIYLLDFNRAEAEENHFSALPDFIKKTKNPPLRRERIFSYMLLEYALKEYYEEKNMLESEEKDYFYLQKQCVINELRGSLSSPDFETLERDEYGRPYFPGVNFDFNLSHDGEMAALVISDQGRVGIDIEKHSENVSTRLYKKLDSYYESNCLLNITDRPDSLDARIKTLAYSNEKGILEAHIDIEKAHDAIDFFTRWTTVESISKADGRGLALFSRIDFSINDFNLLRLSIKDGGANTYSLSISERRIKIN